MWCLEMWILKALLRTPASGALSQSILISRHQTIKYFCMRLDITLAMCTAGRMVQVMVIALVGWEHILIGMKVQKHASTHQRAGIWDGMPIVISKLNQVLNQSLWNLQELMIIWMTKQRKESTTLSSDWKKAVKIYTFFTTELKVSTVE